MINKPDTMTKSPNYEILGIGAPVVDHIIRVSDEFIEHIGGGKGGMVAINYATLENILKEVGEEATLTAGGSSANTIKGLTHYGNKCAFMGKLGKDTTGAVFSESMRLQGVKTLLTASKTLPTAHSLCLVTPDGDRTMRTYLGASQEMDHNDLNDAMFENVKLVHLEGYNLLRGSLVEEAMRRGKEAGALISLDLASYEIVKLYQSRILTLISSYADIVIANADEAMALTGLNPEKSCEMIQTLVDTAVVLIGDKGCWAGRGNTIVHSPAFKVKAIDSTGAGDLFSSGFLHGYLKGLSLEECAALGNKTGSAVVQVLGAEVPSVRWQKILNS